MPEFRRKNIRLPATQYHGQQWYFLTMVLEGRKERFLASPLVTESLSILTEHAQACLFDIPAYCFMPDHLHILTNATREDCRLLNFADGFKQRSAYVFKRHTGERLWQKKFHDHILRKDERWESIACYIWQNPVRKGLCGRAEDWPYSGSLTMDWRRLLSLGIDPWVPPWKRDST